MASSHASRFKRRRVYGLPTVAGLGMFAAIGISLACSLYYRSAAEQWISFLMILLVLVHLQEANDPFRDLSFSASVTEPFFSGRSIFISIRLHNPTRFASEHLDMRLDEEKSWIRFTAISPTESRDINLALPLLNPGRHLLPKLRVRMRLASGLFKLWRVVELDRHLWVLPPPIDHGLPLKIPVARFFHAPASGELGGVDLILDPRHLRNTDQKLLQKTGKAYRRIYEEAEFTTTLFLHWERLHLLSKSHREEQFSSWIESCETRLDNRVFEKTRIDVDAPFLKTQVSLSPSALSLMKRAYADWLYADG